MASDRFKCECCGKDITYVVRHTCPDSQPAPQPEAQETPERVYFDRVVYIAGPMTGYPEFNFPAFDEAAERGRSLGWTVLNPADHDRVMKLDVKGLKGDPSELDGKWDFRAAVKWDTEAVMRSNAIAMLPGWENSTGATAEYHLAKWVKCQILDARDFQPLVSTSDEEAVNAIRKQHHADGSRSAVPMPEFSAGEHQAGDFVLKDTGNRQVFSTGAQRDAGGAKGWFHGLPYIALERWAKWLQAGGQKYGKFNMRKGLPLSSFLDSACRHLLKLCSHEVDEDHAAAVLWNIGEYLWTLDAIRAGKLPRDLYDVCLPNENEEMVLK